MNETIEWNDFEKLDIRVGKITEVQEFPEARRPAYKVWVDFAPEIGVKKTSAQISHPNRSENICPKF